MHLHFLSARCEHSRWNDGATIGRVIMSKSAYRVLYRVGRRVANGRLYGTSTYKGIRAFLRRKLVDDEVVETNGFKMVVDRDLSAFDPTMVGTGKPVWEPEMVEFLSKIVKPGWTVMDLGAESGYFALLMSQLVGSSGCVYAFEADPVSVARINKSVALNRFSNITVVGKAVSDQPGIAKFYPDGMRGAARISPLRQPGRHRGRMRFGGQCYPARCESVVLQNGHRGFRVEGAERNAAHPAVVQFVYHGISYPGIAPDRRRPVGISGPVGRRGLHQDFRC